MTERAEACLASLRAFFSADARVLEWGIAPARPSPHADLLRAWVAQKHHAGMEYMAARLNERMDPKSFHPWAESAVVFAFPYGHPLGSASDAYKVAAYARGGDYHRAARAILRDAEAHLNADGSLGGIRFYGFADTAPVFERDLASEAGLGWRGKNCCTLNRKHGSAFHLAGFFLDLALPASAPLEDFCGGCTRCLDQCPTDAFIAPGRLDANKCISYWTIEDKGALPDGLSDRFGGWIFGCDVCQEVCPWNHKRIKKARAGRIAGDGTKPGEAGPTSAFPESGPAWAELLRKGGGFQSRFKGSPLTRAGRRSLLRNLAAAARNLQDTSVAGPLREALAEESDPAVRTEIEKTLAALGDFAEGKAEDFAN
ncbi:MAG TPA: tRNA epoxyqueuosine(34) reductase QueG [Fibrobacteria bacterium]|nr:tRNA epoxyqueuosine(34) reductase QueG [Fibrobacteria bacterium]